MIIMLFSEYKQQRKSTELGIWPLLHPAPGVKRFWSKPIDFPYHTFMQGKEPRKLAQRFAWPGSCGLTDRKTDRRKYYKVFFCILFNCTYFSQQFTFPNKKFFNHSYLKHSHVQIFKISIDAILDENCGWT